MEIIVQHRSKFRRQSHDIMNDCCNRNSKYLAYSSMNLLMLDIFFSVSSPNKNRLLHRSI